MVNRGITAASALFVVAALLGCKQLGGKGGSREGGAAAESDRSGYHAQPKDPSGLTVTYTGKQTADVSKDLIFEFDNGTPRDVGWVFVCVFAYDAQGAALKFEEGKACKTQGFTHRPSVEAGKRLEDHANLHLADLPTGTVKVQTVTLQVEDKTSDKFYRIDPPTARAYVAP
jgi:hypothetical protein